MVKKEHVLLFHSYLAYECYQQRFFVGRLLSFSLYLLITFPLSHTNLSSSQSPHSFTHSLVVIINVFFDVADGADAPTRIIPLSPFMRRGGGDDLGNLSAARFLVVDDGYYILRARFHAFERSVFLSLDKILRIAFFRRKQSPIIEGTWDDMSARRHFLRLHLPQSRDSKRLGASYSGVAVAAAAARDVHSSLSFHYISDFDKIASFVRCCTERIINETLASNGSSQSAPSMCVLFSAFILFFRGGVAKIPLRIRYSPMKLA